MKKVNTEMKTVWERVTVTDGYRHVKRVKVRVRHTDRKVLMRKGPSVLMLDESVLGSVQLECFTMGPKGGQTHSGFFGFTRDDWVEMAQAVEDEHRRGLQN